MLSLVCSRLKRNRRLKRINTGNDKLLMPKKRPQREKKSVDGKDDTKDQFFGTKRVLVSNTVCLLITQILLSLWHVVFCRPDAQLTHKTSTRLISRVKYPVSQHSSFKQSVARYSSFKQSVARSVSCALFVPIIFSTDIVRLAVCAFQWRWGDIVAVVVFPWLLC